MSDPVIPSGREFDDGLRGSRPVRQVKKVLKRLSPRRRTATRVHEMNVRVADGAGERLPIDLNSSVRRPSTQAGDADKAQPGPVRSRSRDADEAQKRDAQAQRAKADQAGVLDSSQPAQTRLEVEFVAPSAGERKLHAPRQEERSEGQVNGAVEGQSRVPNWDLLVAACGLGELTHAQTRRILAVALEDQVSLNHTQARELMKFLLEATQPGARAWHNKTLPAEVAAVLRFVLELDHDRLAEYSRRLEARLGFDQSIARIRSSASAYPVLKSVADMISAGTSNAAIMQRIGGYDAPAFQTARREIASATRARSTLDAETLHMPLLPLSLGLRETGHALDVAYACLSRLTPAPLVHRPVTSAITALSRDLSHADRLRADLAEMGIALQDAKPARRRRIVTKPQSGVSVNESFPEISTPTGTSVPKCRRCGWRPAERYGICDGCRDFGD